MRRFLLLGFSALAACTAPQPTETALEGTAWVLDTITFADGHTEDGQGATLSFGPDDQVGVQSCNTCGGTYRVEGDVLRFNEIACTMMACESRREIGGHFRGAVPFEHEGDHLRLTLANLDGQPATLHFRPAPPPGP
ncbi:MAG TPA: META domain-containing protein [Rubricoccaceae bacterium]|nr:META domain-containing protein [Rubricoccaceae bacterium]